MRVPPFFHRRGRSVLTIALPIAAGLLAFAVVALMVASPRLTPSLEGSKFREMLDRQTSKGLHFDGHYAPLRRTGFASVETPEFHAVNGFKAMKTLDAWGIAGTFNPWGVLLRRWQLDRVHIDRGKVEVQTYEPKPDPKKPKPWYAILMPDRVYLREVICDATDVTWRMRDRVAGIFGTRLLITPYGRDFEYQATGGKLRAESLTPEMDVRKIHLLITKTILKVPEFELATRGGGAIRVIGEAGMRDDKHVDATLAVERVEIAPWLPAGWREGVRGRATGRLRWRGAAQTIEASGGDGEVRVEGGELLDLPLLDYLAAAASRKSLENVALTSCSAKFSWKHPRLDISAIDLGSEGKFALRGDATVENGALGGTLEFGLAPQYLAWLPRAKEDVFTREEGGLIWTAVRLSGTLAKPDSDLGPRLARALKKDPAAAMGLFFRGAGEWFEQKSRGR